MALTHSKYVRGGLRVPVPESAGEVVAHRFAHEITSAENADGSIIELAVLPAHCRVVDAIFDSEDLDDGTDIVLDIGIMSGQVGEALDDDGNARTCGDELFDGITTAQAGGVVRPTLAKAFTIEPVAYDRSIGVKVVTDSGTDNANAGFGLTLLFGT